jgi:hypothetical protein
MDDTLCRRFFLEPSGPSQRQYEALRAVFLDGCRQKDVAARFGYNYGAFRQLVLQFRADCVAGQPPPFSPIRVRVAHQDKKPRRQPSPSSRPRPIAARLA